MTADGSRRAIACSLAEALARGSRIGKANAMVREIWVAKPSGRFSRWTPYSVERWDHLSGEPLELLGVVDERVKQNQLRAGVRHRADAHDAGLSRAREQVF